MTNITVTCKNMSMDSLWYKHLKINNNANTLKNNYDVIIIGAGIAGLSCAYWLQKSNLKVLVVEKSHFAYGASGRNAGFLTGGSIGYFQYLRETYGDEEALKKWSFTTQNVRLLKEHVNMDNCDYREAGTISLYPQEDDISHLKESVALLQNNQFLVRVVEQTFNMQGIAIETDATFNPFLVLKEIMIGLNNTDFLFENEVDEISSDFIKVGSQKISAAKIILATNYEIPRFLPQLKIEPQRSQICFIECDCDVMGEANYFIPQKRIYFRKHQNGLIIGGLRGLDLEVENTNELALNAKIQDALLVQCAELFGESKLVKSWAGIMGFTADEQPLLGEENGVYYLGGFSGHGNGYAFTMARDLIDKYILN